MNIDIQQVESFSHPEIVEEIVWVYCRAFGGEPWNEGYVCPVCRKTFPLLWEFSKVCPVCVGRGSWILLVEYWPISTVISDFYREMAKPQALCLVAKNECGKVVGFIWGYCIVADANIDDYLEAPGLSQLIAGEFFYLDDAAVSPEYQRKGIGKKLLTSMLSAQSGKNILGRTLHQSQMFGMLTDFGGKIIQAITRNRVIMTISL